MNDMAEEKTFEYVVEGKFVPGDWAAVLREKGKVDSRKRSYLTFRMFVGPRWQALVDGVGFAVILGAMAYFSWREWMVEKEGAEIGVTICFLVFGTLLLINGVNKYRRYGTCQFMRDAKRGRRIKYIVTKEGIEIDEGQDVLQMSWHMVRWVCWVRDGVYLEVSKKRYAMLKRDCFRTEADWEACALVVYRKMNQCAKCGYLLKGSVSDGCPECGDDLVEQVRKLSR
ncbi:YcxB family protein [Poriferisphaera sp. WC338]|uniref:YcxB family protein n=1 Tax=Poriferisphaera sp. WC338 TaxID=3425129 RepID=UPI003D8174FF